MSQRRTRKTRRKPTHSWLKMSFQQLTSPVEPFRWVSEEKLEQLHDASMWILENVGMAFMERQALSIWEQAGAKVDHKEERVWIDRGLLMESIAHAPAQFTWHARNPKYNLAIGGNYLNFTPASGMPYVSDLDGGRRPGSLADFTKFVKLAHTLPFFHIAGGPFLEPQDIPVSLRHLERMRILLTHTDRVVRDVAHGYVIPEDEVAMAKIACGGTLPGPCIGGTINVTSPLRLDDRMIGGLITYARHGQVTFNTPFIMAGATSPATIAGALAQQNAEALAVIALAQLVNPGAPAIYGGFTQNVDMRSGSPAFGGPEGAWGLLVGAQLARRYGLPFRAGGSLTNAKVPDAQAAYESQWTMWPVVLAHTNLILHAVGWLEGGLVASFEKFIIDTECLAMFFQFLNNFTIDNDELGLESIAEVGIGGHHFGTEHTLARYESAFYEPVLSDRQSYDPWQAAGEQDAVQRANRTYKSLLEAYEAPPIDPGIQEELDAYVERRSGELAGVDLYA
ncbi:trimethylamine methyltransferase family protein [Chloroflexi bacterium TSY]|nr:trimethylamine methyltransferase family protein [Chloroflexi bacterium TSY]